MEDNMPIYAYSCRACGLDEERLAGIDDRTLICTECGEVMDRQVSVEEAFNYYFQPPKSSETENTG
jgi:putative FmdB family regulatory protein